MVSRIAIAHNNSLRCYSFDQLQLFCCQGNIYGCNVNWSEYNAGLKQRAKVTPTQVRQNYKNVTNHCKNLQEVEHCNSLHLVKEDKHDCFTEGAERMQMERFLNITPLSCVLKCGAKTKVIEIQALQRKFEQPSSIR